jgi:hypothetical protein
MKKALSILLSLILVLAALPFSAVESAATDYYTSQDGLWVYYLDPDNGYAIIYNNANKAYLGTDANVTVPSVIDGHTVVSLGQYSFKACTTLESIVIPSTVETIANHVFYDCTNLASVTINGNVGGIAQYTFYNCQSLTEINLPDTVQTIGSYAFCNCSNLEKIFIPTGLTYIDGYAFNNCNKLATYVKDLAAWCGINFYNGSGYYSNPMERGHILYIYDSVADDYVLAEDIVIPNGVTGIPVDAFDGCTTVKSIVIPEGVTTLGQYTFRGCTNLESVSIPSTMTAISNNAFQSCNKLNAVHTPSIEAWCNITFADSGANPLSYAKNLYIGDTLATDITIPSTVTTVKNNAFYYCTSLVNVTLASGVTTVNQAAFYNCTNLETVTIPDTLTTINNYAFYNCNKLNAVYITDLEAWCDITFTNVDANPLYKAHNLYINNVLSTVTVPTTVSQIKQYTFAGLGNDVIIPGNVTTIGNYAFYGGTLESATLQEGVQTIKSNAFCECRQMTSIYFPTTITVTENYAFNFCSKLGTYITDMEAWCNVQFGDSGGYYANPLETGHNLYLNGNLVTDLVIPDTITEIKYCSFMGGSCIKTVTIPEGVTTIGRLAFYYCTNLESITIPSTLTTIHNDRVFQSCSNLKEVHISDLEAWCNIPFPNNSSNPLYYAKNLYLGNNKITDLVIPSTVTTIKPYTFYNCSGLTSLTIPDNVTAISNESFYGCSGLQSITVGDSLTTVGNNAFYNCSGLNAVYITDLEQWCDIQFGNQTSNPLYYGHNLYVNNVCSDITIPSTVTQLKQYAFTGLANNVTIPGNVTEIGLYAFADGKFTTAVMQEGVQIIKDHAFNNCKNMTSVYFPASITKTEEYAFGSCTNCSTYITDLEAWCNVQFGGGGGYYANPLETGRNLYLNNELVTDLVIPDSVTELKYCSFMGCSMRSVRLPKGLTKIGNLSFYNCTNLKSIVIPDTVETIGTDRVFAYCNSLTDYYCFIGTRGDTYWTTAATKNYMGDMNTDGVIDALDVADVMSVASGNTVPNDEVLEIAADYNLDGVIDGFDAAAIDRYFDSVIHPRKVSVNNLEQLQTALNTESVREVIVTTGITLPDGTVLDGLGKTVRVEKPYVREDGTLETSATPSRVFSIESGSHVSISNMTVMGGEKSGTAAISLIHGYLTMENVNVVRSNRGLDSNGTAILKNCNFSLNVCKSAGAIWTGSGAILVLDGCSFTKNRSNGGSSSGGGAIGLSGSGSYLYANNTVFADNASQEIGGAINVYDGNAYLMNCTVTGNCTSNSASCGGGIGKNGGSFYAVNCLFTDNYATIKSTPTRSDIGKYSGSNSVLYNCLYGTLQGSATVNDCKTDLTATVANEYANAPIILSEGTMSVDFIHPVLSDGTNSFSKYVPVNPNGNATTGGVSTYFDYSDINNVKMGYGTDDNIIALGGLTAPDSGKKVTTYLEGGVRNGNVIGASACG